MEATQRQEEAASVHRQQRDALMIELMVSNDNNNSTPISNHNTSTITDTNTDMTTAEGCSDDWTHGNNDINKSSPFSVNK